MADTSTVTVAPPLLPPLLEVGYNYTWPLNRYGTSIGPRDLQNNPPTGANSTVPVFEDKALVPPAGTLARNLAFLRDQMNIKKVRMFLLGNAFNYGTRPLGPLSGGTFVFTAPPQADPLFFAHFRAMLRIFKANGMQIVPSLIDFGAFYPAGSGGGSGRTSILTSQRKLFLETMLLPMLRVAQEKGLEGTVLAWEVVNEPMWNTVGLPVRPHTDSLGPDIDPDIMVTFIQDCLDLIKAEGFESTVGHRRLKDLQRFPQGTKPQFHYYANTVLHARIFGVDDPDPIPTFAELAKDPRTANAFVGEFSADQEGAGFFDKGQGRRWPECQGRDNTVKDAAFERLKILARKGYRLAFVWPNRPDGTRENDRDDLKLTPDAIDSVKKFTLGRFPNGVP
jgi:hypothetical protein